MSVFYTMGHSNRSFDEFTQLLKYYGIDYVADVRRFPTSKFEHFKKEFLEKHLKNYVWIPELGGFRGGYEKYMQSSEFKIGLEKLKSLSGRVAILCAEKLYFRCHRRYIAEALAKAGEIVIHVEDGREYFDKNFQLRELPSQFFARKADVVASELIGKIIVHKVGRKLMAGRIVETEAYFGLEDPASRAYGGKKNMNAVMWEDAGTIFVYMVHANWLLNIVTGSEDDPQAVLIRAVEPLIGLRYMYENRGVASIYQLCNGPGKFTKAFAIDVRYNRQKIGGEIKILDAPPLVYERSYRIGVSRDLPTPLRFVAKSRFVSRAP